MITPDPLRLMESVTVLRTPIGSIVSQPNVIRGSNRTCRQLRDKARALYVNLSLTQVSDRN